MRGRFAAALAIAALASVTGGCASAGYYWQSVAGHAGLLAARRPAETVIADARTTAHLRARLAEALEMRAFAVDALGLPDNASYRGYVALEHPFVTWAVVATPQLSLDPVTWCFPVVGCVAYRAYFERTEAEAFAGRLASRGLDVHVSGVAAYSTLGWTDDPLLSSMVLRPEPYLAEILFHELTHQRLYVADDTAFNEAYAVAVERAGVRRWLGQRGRGEALVRYERHLGRERAFVAVVEAVRAALRAVYASDRDDAWKLERKAAILAGLVESHAALRRQWGGRSPFEGWFRTPPGNARLALVATYHHWVPAFERLLDRAGGDLARFHREVERLGELPRDARHARLRALGGDQPAPASRQPGGEAISPSASSGG